MMKLLRPTAVLLTALTLALTIAAQPTPAAETDDGPVYELRIYTCEPGKLEALNQRFREHTMTIFARHGIENVGY